MNVMEILEAYRFWDDFVRRKELEIDRLRARMMNVKAIRGEPLGGEPYSLEEYAAEQEQLSQDLEEGITKCDEALVEILRLISGLDPKRFDVMYRRYICLMSWGRIAQDTHTKRSTVQNRHDSAITYLTSVHLRV